MLLEKSFCESNHRHFRRHGSGKTTVANRILETVRASEVVFPFSRNSYIALTDCRSTTALCNFDHPTQLITLLVHHVRKLRAGEPIDLPMLRFPHAQRLNENARSRSKTIRDVEGILILLIRDC